MSLHSLDLRPIKSFESEKKRNLAVSIAMQPNGTPFVVSRYGDDIWDFYPYIPQENRTSRSKQLDWRIALPDGRRLTDPEHEALLQSVKDFIWSLFAEPVEGRKRPTMRTIIGKQDNLLPLLRWMVKTGLRRFSDLSGRTLDCVQVLKLKENGKDQASDSTVAKRLIVVEDLYHQRDKLHDALLVHPWPHESAVSLAGLKNGGANRKPKTDFIPDAIAGRLAKAAVDYVQNRATRILEALEAVAAASEKTKAARLGKISISKYRTITARKADYAGSNELTTEMIRLRTACYIVIGIFSGIRDSEIMSIGESCVAHRQSRDGSCDVTWLHGTLYKTGIRPKAWQVPPVVEEAIAVLKRLTAPMRKALRREEIELDARIKLVLPKEKAHLVKRLDTVHRQKDKLFLARAYTLGGPISVLSGASMFRDLKRFCADLDIRGEDGQAYPLHSHQFRRTYARFMARSELGDLLTLRDHFGHWSLDMTVFYADGGADEYEADTELLEMITEEKQVRQTEVMEGYLDSNTPLANGGHWLHGWRATVRTAANKEELITQYAGSITLNGTGHSWCVGNAKGTGCGGLCIFEAQMCVDCNYGIIGVEHRPVWEGIRDQQKEALGLSDMGIAGSARAQVILDHAEKVLRRLDGQEEK